MMQSLSLRRIRESEWEGNWWCIHLVLESINNHDTGLEPPNHYYLLCIHMLVTLQLHLQQNKGLICNASYFYSKLNWWSIVYTMVPSSGRTKYVQDQASYAANSQTWSMLFEDHHHYPCFKGPHLVYPLLICDSMKLICLSSLSYFEKWQVKTIRLEFIIF
jgi:hypothetical protein